MLRLPLTALYLAVMGVSVQSHVGGQTVGSDRASRIPFSWGSSRYFRLVARIPCAPGACPFTAGATDILDDSSSLHQPVQENVDTACRAGLLVTNLVSELTTQVQPLKLEIVGKTPQRLLALYRSAEALCHPRAELRQGLGQY